jgi:translation initiation factor 4G
MEGEPEAWTTVEKKPSKKKENVGERAQASGTAGDRRKKDYVTSRSDRGDRRPHDNRDRRQERGGVGGAQQGEHRGGGRRPPSGRGSSAQRNTLPKKPRDGEQGAAGQGGRGPHRSGGSQQGHGGGNSVEKKPNTVVANPWEALAASSSSSSATNSPRKQSWASLVDRGASVPKETTPPPPVSSCPWAPASSASKSTTPEIKQEKVAKESKPYDKKSVLVPEPAAVVEIKEPALKPTLAVETGNVKPAETPLPSETTVSKENEKELKSSTAISTITNDSVNCTTDVSAVDLPLSPEESKPIEEKEDAPKPNLESEKVETEKDANDNHDRKEETDVAVNLECDKQVANSELSNNEPVPEVPDEIKTYVNVSTNQTNITTQQATNEITNKEPKDTNAVTNLVDTKVDNKSHESLDNEQEGLSMKIDKDVKDDSLDANGNNVSLDSNKNKLIKGMTPDMEEILSRIGPDTRHYDRDVLLMLQQHPLSLQKPDKLPELEIVLDAPLRSSASAPLLGDKPMGGNVSAANSFGRPGGMPTKRDSRRKEPKKVISLSREAVKLRTSENAYKPNKKENNDTEMEALGKRVIAILNKLTPQKFQTLVVQFKELEINTEERLRLAIELIFEKAVEEPAYSTAYATLCKELSKKRVTKEGSEEVVDFRSLLLEQCRNEFQKDYLSESARTKYTEDMKKAETEEEKRKIKAEFQLLESKMRKRSLGNIRFIGELYLQQLTRQQIIHQNIISRLLSNTDEESLECLCRFLSTCGAKLEADQANIPENIREQFNFDRYFTRVKSIVDEKKTTSRVRFMLQDLIELKANKWVSKRRKEAGPKTIDDIHKEAKLEALRTQLADSQPHTPVARRSEEKTRRKTEYRPKPILSTDEGWSNVPTKAAKISLDMDPSKLRSIRKVDADSLRLGGPYTSWGMGSSSAAKAAAASSNITNSFQLLEDIDQPPPQPVQAEGSHMYAGRASEPVIRSFDRSSSRASASLDKSRGQEDRDSTSLRRVLRGPADTDTEALRSKFKLILREHLSNCDFQETLNSVCELFSQSTIEILVEETINQGLEEIDLKNRSACGRLLYDLVKDDVMSLDSIWQGMSMPLEIAEDIIIDIPRFWEFLADILVIVVVELSCFNALVQSCASCLPDLSMRKKIISSLLLAVKKMNHDKLSSYLANHKSLIKEFVSQDLAEFLQEFNISVEESTASTTGEVESAGAEKLVNGNLQESLQRQLTGLLEKCDTGNQEIEAVDKIMRDKPLDNETIRTLVYAVMESVVGEEEGGPCSIKKDLLSERIPILKKYIDAIKERELYAMFALQNVVNKLHHPNKLLHNMIELLYDGEVISDDGIFDWEKNMDVDEQEGKGVAVAGCKQFLEWLRTAEEASEEECP